MINILAFFAHPDDETMLAGGTLALLARAGAQVHYVSATRGEGGEMGEPPLCTREELGRVRENELVCAVQALGGRSLTFLGYVDPTVGPGDELFPYADNLAMLAGQVDASIRVFQAQVVITHGSDGEYGHPAHKLTHTAARISVEAFGKTDPGAPQPLFYTVSASFEGNPRPRLANKSDPADIIVDVTSALAQKEQAAMCHRTQHDLFVRRASEDAGRRLTVPEVLVKVEALHRAYPLYDVIRDEPLGDLLKPWRIDGK